MQRPCRVCARCGTLCESAGQSAAELIGNNNEIRTLCYCLVPRGLGYTSSRQESRANLSGHCLKGRALPAQPLSPPYLLGWKGAVKKIAAANTTGGRKSRFASPASLGTLGTKPRGCFHQLCWLSCRWHRRVPAPAARWGWCQLFRERGQSLGMCSGTRGSDRSSPHPRDPQPAQPRRGAQLSLPAPFPLCRSRFDRSSRSPDFHNNIFSRTGYISNQLLHHGMFQHKYMQRSAATILGEDRARCKPRISLPRTEQHSGDSLDNKLHKNPSGKPLHLHILVFIWHELPSTTAQERFAAARPALAPAELPPSQTPKTLPVLQARHGHTQSLSPPDGTPSRSWECFLFPPPHNNKM